MGGGGMGGGGVGVGVGVGDGFGVGVGDGFLCVPEYLRRVVCYQQMDFDFMLWQMIYLFLSPSKVFVFLF